jgi:hypothetical protein
MPAKILSAVACDVKPPELKIENLRRILILNSY